MAYLDAEKSLCEQATLINSIEEYTEWEKKCDELIDAIKAESKVKRIRLRLGFHQYVAAQILRLEGIKHATSQRFIHVGAGIDNGLIWRETETAFKNRVTTGAVINRSHIDPRLFLMDASEIVIQKVRDSIEQHDCVKVNTMFNGEFTAGDKHMYKSINARNVELFRTSELRAWYEQRIVEPTLALLDEFQERDSGWALTRILNLTVNINKYKPLSAGCHIRLSRDINSKKAVVNVKSRDNACFAWAVVAALYPAAQHSDRVSSYPHYSTVLNFTGIPFPLAINNVKKFEVMNNLSINVYGMKKDAVVPIHVTQNKKDKHVNLLYIEDVRHGNIGHYVWIKSLPRLVGLSLSKHRAGKHICDR